jgi:hypothetical protein
MRFERQARHGVELLGRKCFEVRSTAQGEQRSTRYSVIAASTPIDTRLKNAASRARSLLTGFSKTNKISSRAIAQISKNSSAAIWKRHSDSIDLMFAAVAVASPDTISLSRTNTSPKRPTIMMIRYSTPPVRAYACGEVLTLSNICHFGSLGNLTSTSRKGLIADWDAPSGQTNLQIRAILQNEA